MTLPGIDPLDPTPSDRRSIVLAAGESGAPNAERNVVLYGNKTSAGSETVNVVDKTSPVADDADARARAGARSELYWMYRTYMQVDPGATIYLGPVAESGGSAAYVDFVIAGGATATANSTLIFTILGVEYSVTVTSGDTVKNVVDNSVAVLNAAEDSCLPIVASNTGPDTTVRITASQKGPRHGAFLGGAGFGVRAEFSDACTLTCTKSAVTAGVTEDDGTTLFANVAGSEFYYHVSPWITASPSGTDNQIGELVELVRAQDQPINGKDQIVISSLRGTNGASITTVAAVNSWLCHFAWQEASEWMPGMVAAFYAAVKRRNEVAHPCANFAGYTVTDETPCPIPPQALTADYPTAVEIKAALNNGFCPIAVNNLGNTYIVRDVTSRCKNTAGDYDYRARPGHLRSAMAFYWLTIKQRWASQKRAFVDDDPPPGTMPTPNTTTPSLAKGMVQKVIDDLVAGTPFGLYNGPILAPSQAKWMKDRVVATKIPAGISISSQVKAVEHLYKSETTINEASASG